jgi:hypothetical protein
MLIFPLTVTYAGLNLKGFYVQVVTAFADKEKRFTYQMYTTIFI